MKTFCQSQEFLLFPKLILVSGLLTSGFYCLFLRLSRICFFLFHTPPPVFLFFVFDRVSCPHPECWDFQHIPHALFNAVLGTEPLALCLLH